MSIAFLILGLFLFFQASQLSMRSLDGGPGPGLLPATIGALMAVLATRLVLAGHWRERPEFGTLWRIGVMVVTVAMYAAVLDRLGFVVATAVLMLVLLVSFNERHRVPLAVLGVLGTGLTYAVFYSFLKVQLPPDPWGLWR
jgi:putative tricarboxylic transport membrane protein